MNHIGVHIKNALEQGRVKNAAELARCLRVNRSTVSRWISGEKAPSAEEARALAELIGAPAGMVMAECEAQRAKDDATRAEWLRVARWCKGQAELLTTVALMLMAVVVLYTTGAENLLQSQMLAAGTVSDLSIMVVLVGIVTVTLFAARKIRPRAPRRWPVL
jgi:transcriptional regulator with XRE-family HTH domain